MKTKLSCFTLGVLLCGSIYAVPVVQTCPDGGGQDKHAVNTCQAIDPASLQQAASAGGCTNFFQNADQQNVYCEKSQADTTLVGNGQQYYLCIPNPAYNTQQSYTTNNAPCVPANNSNINNGTTSGYFVCALNYLEPANSEGSTNFGANCNGNAEYGDAPGSTVSYLCNLNDAIQGNACLPNLAPSSAPTDVSTQSTTTPSKKKLPRERFQPFMAKIDSPRDQCLAPTVLRPARCV